MINHSLDSPLVTVIVPSYNHGRFVLQTMESIVTQTYPNIQLIVIDDASKDNTAKIIADFGCIHPIDMVLNQANTGLISSLNQGLTMAKGKYISLVASDDYWAPEKIARQVTLLEKDNDLKIVFTEGYEVDENGNILEPIHYTNRIIEKWTFKDVIMKADLPPASFIARRDEILSVGGFCSDFKFEDLPMWLMLLANGGYAKVIKEPLVYYRSHESNMHNLFSAMIADQHFEMIKKYSQGLQNRKSILAEWRLRNANIFARVDKLHSIKYLIPALYKVLDYRVYACIFKYIFR
jgi:alpha-1,3-rhamnosyltransferase